MLPAQVKYTLLVVASPASSLQLPAAVNAITRGVLLVYVQRDA